MGLFDNVFRSLDDTLKAIEEGAIERKLDVFGKSLERMSQKAPEVLEKVTDAPANIVQHIETRADTLKQAGLVAKNEATKTIDIIHRQD